MRKTYMLLGLLVGISMILTACGPAAAPEAPAAEAPAAEAPAAEAPAEEATGPKVLMTSFSGSGDVPTLDPAVAEDTSSIQVVEETFIGLTNLDEVTNAIQPGMAESWDAVDNADGTQTVTFHMRNNIPWVRWNGEEVETVKTCDGSADRLVTAHDFAYGIERHLKPETASPYAYLLGFVLQGASAFNNGETDDFSTVGVKAVDDFTVEMTFVAPAAYNTQIAGLWVARPQPKWQIEGDCEGAVEGRGDRWTEPGFFQSYGPFTMSEWIHDSEMTLVKNPFWPGTAEIPQSEIDQVHFVMLDPVAQLAEYEAGNLDVTNGVPSEDLDRIRADATLSAELSQNPSLCTYFYGFNTTAPVVSDVRVRRALSMAVDRQSLIDNVLKGGQQPAQWFSRPGLDAAPTMDTHPDLGIKYDVAAAQAELQAYLDETGQTADQLDLTVMFNTSSGHQRIAEASPADVEGQPGRERQDRQPGMGCLPGDHQGSLTPRRSGASVGAWTTRMPTTSCERSSHPTARPTRPLPLAIPPVVSSGRTTGYEELMTLAAAETDPAKRLEMYAEAEDILVNQDAVIIPFYWYTDLDMTRPYISRTYGSGGHERYEKWDILAH